MKWDEIQNKEGDERSITLTVQEQYVLMNLALLMLRAPSLFITDVDENNTEEINDFIDTLIYSVINEEIPPPVLGAISEVNLLGHEASVVSGSLTVATNTSQIYNVTTQNNPISLNTKLRWTRVLSAGNWSFSYHYVRTATSGIIDIYVTPDGGSTVTILNDHDMRGTTLFNQFVRGTFTLNVSGPCTIEVQVVATSLGTNYNNQMTVLQMWRIS